ncbi:MULTISPECIES: RidA family protein [Pseudomonas]|uniref:Reactive intermediate/imine deaminase n=1 Tax=Pseudomonas asplenii TaxID=53407 RepID=A0A0M9GII9_9PSED|nr:MULTISPECIES: RidA family protein [Pseudomonas]KPA92072.1 reactive intermediate/imine deaminase [Pseudomonas fuscovaginae]KPA99386.1 reactive intermediate/imine deaminase [Pseudomonas fuscovaginae]
MKTITSANAPAAIGPYSQAKAFGNLIFTSGQIPLDPASGQVVEGGIREQALQTIKNLEAVLKEGGVGFEQVMKTTCFLHDMADFAVFNEVYEQFFVSKPARSCVAVKTLPKGVLVEIEAIAVSA